MRCNRVYYSTKGISPSANINSPNIGSISGYATNHWHPHTDEGCKIAPTYCDGLNLPSVAVMLSANKPTSGTNNNCYACGGKGTKKYIYKNDAEGWGVGWICTNCNRRYYSTKGISPSANINSPNVVFIEGYSKTHHHRDTDEGCR